MSGLQVGKNWDRVLILRLISARTQSASSSLPNGRETCVLSGSFYVTVIKAPQE